MKNCLILILLSLIVSSCSRGMVYDFAKLQSYTPELESNFFQEYELKAPYIAQFDMQTRRVLYIASNHEIDVQSETFQLISKAFKKYRPDFLIIEGIEEKHGESPERLISHIKTNCLPEWKCSEGLFAAHLATKNSIDFIGGEPADQEIYKILKSQKYTKKDFVFLIFIQQIPHYHREGRFNAESELPKLLMQFLQDWKATEFTYLDFKSWYEKNGNVKISYQDLIDPNIAAPIKNGTYVQRLSTKISDIRNKHIVSVILKSLVTHKKVLIIYGHSHFPTQKDVLIQYLGKPKYFNYAIYR